MSSLSIGKHVLEIQGQRIDLIVVTAYGESNELVSEVDGPRLIVENVDPVIDKKMEARRSCLLPRPTGRSSDLNPFAASIACNPGPDTASSINNFSTRYL